MQLHQEEINHFTWSKDIGVSLPFLAVIFNCNLTGWRT